MTQFSSRGCFTTEAFGLHFVSPHLNRNVWPCFQTWQFLSPFYFLPINYVPTPTCSTKENEFYNLLSKTGCAGNFWDPKEGETAALRKGNTRGETPAPKEWFRALSPEKSALLHPRKYWRGIFAAQHHELFRSVNIWLLARRWSSVRKQPNFHTQQHTWEEGNLASCRLQQRRCQDQLFRHC